MLSKLMKHELRATGRIMLPVFLLVLVASGLANLSSRVLTENDSRFLNGLGVLLMMVFVISIIAMGIIAFVLMIQRFSTSLLRDEGYVMMTLPVSVHSHVWSKLITSLLWYAGTAVVMVLSIFILSFDIEFMKQLGRFIGDLLEMLPKLDGEFIDLLLFFLELLLLALSFAVASCLMFYAALAVGNSFAKHKTLYSVIFFFASQFVLQLLGITLLPLIADTGIFDSMMTPIGGNNVADHMMMMLIILAISLLHGSVFYFITTYFLKKRLNLE